MIKRAPILLFCYKRLESLQQTVKALEKCVLAPESELYIFSDGAKTDKDQLQIDQVRTYVKGIKGFKKVTVNESPKNKGLATSIIEGVSEVMKFSDRVIVLEDDLLVSGNFLAYMNEGLEFYAGCSEIFSVTGYTIPINIPKGYKYDVYYLPRTSSWGWATWKNRWEGIDWEVSDFIEFSKNKKSIRAFNRGGSDMFAMLKKQMNNEIDSWAIRWSYHQFKINSYSVFPTSSKVQNIGFTSDATNTNVFNRYYTTLDNGSALNFNFSNEIPLDPIFLGQVQRFFSVQNRIVSRIKTYLFKAKKLGISLKSNLL